LCGTLGLRNVEQTFHSDVLKCCTGQNLITKARNILLKMPIKDQIFNMMQTNIAILLFAELWRFLVTGI